MMMMMMMMVVDEDGSVLIKYSQFLVTASQ
jgi:hypothetical protein